MTTRLLSYLLALSVVTVVLVYILDVPTFVSQAPKLVREYYYDNAVQSFVLDVFLFMIYISVGMFVADRLHIKPTDDAARVMTLAATSAALSTLAMFLFVNSSRKSFFTRWFKAVGARAIVYDVIMVCSVYVVMVRLHETIL
jgi:hypothetical protein